MLVVNHRSYVGRATYHILTFAKISPKAACTVLNLSNDPSNGPANKWAQSWPKAIASASISRWIGNCSLLQTKRPTGPQARSFLFMFRPAWTKTSRYSKRSIVKRCTSKKSWPAPGRLSSCRPRPGNVWPGSGHRRMTPAGCWTAVLVLVRAW